MSEMSYEKLWREQSCLGLLSTLTVWVTKKMHPSHSKTIARTDVLRKHLRAVSIIDKHFGAEQHLVKCFQQ